MSDNDAPILDDYNGQKLSAKEKRNLVRRILPDFISSTTTARNAYDAFSKAGLAINKREFMDMYTEITGGGKSAYNIRFVNRTRKPSEDILRKSFFRIQGKYRFVAKLTVEDNNTGEIFQIPFAIDTSTIVSIAELEDKITSAFMASDSGTGKTVLNSRILRGYKS